MVDINVENNSNVKVVNEAVTEVSGESAKAETKIETRINDSSYSFEASSPGKYRLEIKSVEGGKPTVVLETEVEEKVKGAVEEAEEKEKEVKKIVEGKIEKVIKRIVSFLKKLFSF